MEITLESLKSLINEAVRVNLENCMTTLLTSESKEKDEDMKRYAYTYNDGNGNEQTVRIFGNSRTDADKKFQDFISDIDEGSMTFRQFIEDYYTQGFLPKKATTRATYEYYIEHYMYPIIGDIELLKIKVKHVQQIMDYLANGKKNGLKKNIVSGTISRVVGLLSHIMRIAQASDLIPANPVKTVLLQNRGEESGHHIALADEDIHYIKTQLPEMEDDHEKVCLALIAYTGCRPEEIRGIRWEDVDLAERYISIKRAVTYAGKKSRTHVDTPKSEASKRTVYIPEPLLKILESVKDKRGYLVHAIRNKENPIPESSWKRLIKSGFTNLGISGCTPYDFRATFATQCKESGITSAQVADLMGHADTRMVETVYAKTRHQSVMKQSAKLEALNEQYANHVTKNEA